MESGYGVIVQARASSSRLPGKVLRDIAGKPMLLRQLERLRHGLKMDKLMVATSVDPSDDPVESLCRTHGFRCYRGSLDDVMGRLIECGRDNSVNWIVRVGGDDPLIDWQCCKHLVELHQATPRDFLYASNRDGWPYGAAAELISVRALEDIHSRTKEKLYLEHTIPYFFDHPEEFSVLRVKAPKEVRYPELAFTVDFPEDFDLVTAVFKELIPVEGEYFPLASAIRLVQSRPDLRSINAHLHHGFDR